MKFLIGFLMSVQVIICVLLVTVVLMQRSKSDGLSGGSAFGGAFTDTFFGGGSANVLVKITSWLGGIFFALCLLLAVLFVHVQKSGQGALKKLVAGQPASSASATNAVAESAAAPAGATNAAPVKP